MKPEEHYKQVLALLKDIADKTTREIDDRLLILKKAKERGLPLEPKDLDDLRDKGFVRKHETGSGGPYYGITIKGKEYLAGMIDFHGDRTVSLWSRIKEQAFLIAIASITAAITAVITTLITNALSK